MRPTIGVTKLNRVDEAGHFRYYGASGQKGSKAAMFTLDARRGTGSNGRTYTYLPIRTEKELVWFVYNNFGVGIYRIVAYRGRGMAYTFWRGEITYEGYCFFEKKRDEREIKRLEKEREQAAEEGDQEALELINDDIGYQKGVENESRAEKKYGFSPFLRRSGQRGEFHSWTEEDEGYEPQLEEQYGETAESSD